MPTDPDCKRLFLTIGIHPTRCNEFAASSSSGSNSNSSSSREFEAFVAKVEEGGLRLSDYPAVYVHHLFELYQLLQQQQQQQQQRIVAIGEIGLDYDRLHFCDAAMQKESVKKTQTLNPKPFWAANATAETLG